MKKCKVCGIKKSLNEFYVNKTYADGYSSKCRDCKNQQAREYRAKERLAKKMRTKKKNKSSKVTELSKQAEAIKLQIRQTTPEEKMSYKIILDKNDNPVAEAVEPTNQTLSEQEREVLEYISKTISRKGSSPSYKQIGLDMGIKSNGLVGKLINSLTDKEYIKRPEGGRRRRHGISLTSKCDNIIRKKEPVTLASSLKGTIADILNRSKTVTISATGEMTFWINNREDK